MKRFIYILTLLLASACMDIKDSNPYDATLNDLTVTAQWPDGDFSRAGAAVRVEDMNKGSWYSVLTDEAGVAVLSLPNGLYRININGRSGTDVFNGAADKVVVSGRDLSVTVPISVSKAGSIVIKELYCGGCKRLPQEGNYQYDQYFILHNNHYEVQYLDSLCFGTLSPYNATGSNPWVEKDPITGGSSLPDFVPVIQAIWQFPGDGDDFPLQPGEDAVVCLRGAVDHSAQYPLSVDLNRPDYFVCYNNTYFPNTTYHPAPGNNISPDRYIDVVVKMGQANAYTLSNASPAVVIFKARDITIQEHVRKDGSIIDVPGSTVDDVVKIPFEWVVDAMEVFDGRSATNTKRLVPSLDAGYAVQTDIYLGHTLMRYVDEQASVAAGYEVLKDTNNSLNDFYERETQSLHE